MTNPMNIRVSKAEYDRWLDYLRTQGFKIAEVSKGGMVDTIQANISNPDGGLNPSFGGMSFVDAEKGRRVYMIQLRAVVPNSMAALMDAARLTQPALAA